jgi:hypothetical protein
MDFPEAFVVLLSKENLELDSLTLEKLTRRSCLDSEIMPKVVRFMIGPTLIGEVQFSSLGSPSYEERLHEAHKYPIFLREPKGNGYGKRLPSSRGTAEAFGVDPKDLDFSIFDPSSDIQDFERALRDPVLRLTSDRPDWPKTILKYNLDADAFNKYRYNLKRREDRAA